MIGNARKYAEMELEMAVTDRKYEEISGNETGDGWK